MSSTYGENLKLSIFGQSHGQGIGMTLDGIPAGLPVDLDKLQQFLNRRAPGQNDWSTPRKEEDRPEFLAGLLDGHTCGAPIAAVIYNKNTRSKDYSNLHDVPRPGHADYTAQVKYGGYQDVAGGGHFSGRLTLPVVAAGVVAKKILQDATILDETPFTGVNARIVELGGKKEDWQAAIDKAIREGDSLGAVVECTVPDIDPGYGEPFWDSVESRIAHAVFAIPGVRGIEFGDGFAAASMTGSQHTDPIGPDGRPTKNGAGGVNGGITNGAPISFRVAFKPTSSIRKAQQTFNFEKGEMDTLEVPGRHDVCFALRAPVVVEAMTAIVLADLALVK